MKPGGKIWTALWALILVGSPLIEGGTTYIPVTGLRLAVLALAVGWLWQGVGQPGWTAVSSRWNLPIIAFWALSAVALALSPYRYIAAYWYLTIFFFILLFYLGLQTAAAPPEERDRRLRGGVGLLLLTAAGLSAWAIAEYLLGFSTRASAGFFNPNGLAGYLLAVSPLALSRLLGGKESAGWRLLYGVALALMVGAVLCTRSRALVLFLPIWGIPAFFRWRWKSLALVGLAAVFLAAVPNPLRERMLTLRQGDPYAWERVRIYAASLEMIGDHPLGVGLGMYKYYYPRYGRAVEAVKVGRWEKTASNAHSELLHLAAELSPLAPLLLLFLGLGWAGLGIAVFRPRGPSPDPDAFGAAVGLLGVAGHGLIDANLHETAVTVAAIALAALVSIRLGEGRRGGLRLSRPVFGRPGFLRMLLILATPLIAAALIALAASYGLTEAYRRLPDRTERIRRLARIAPYNPGYAPLPHSLSTALYAQAAAGQNLDLMEKAAREEDAAWRLNPEDAKYPEGLGVIYLALAGMMDNHEALLLAAEKSFREAQRLSPNSPFLFYRQAELARVRRQAAEEERLLREALEREPYFFSARAHLAFLLLRTGRPAGARREAESLNSQIAEINAMLKRQPEAFNTLYQRELLSLPAGLTESLAAAFTPAAPGPAD